MLIRKIWDDVKSTLWFIPGLWVIGMGALAIVSLTVDRRLAQLETAVDWPWYLVGSPEGVRTMLGSVSTAMLTVASLTFSIMMLVVVQTARAYSPRILREYLGDKANQHMLGIFIGTFLFSLLVLRGVRSTDEGQFVPIAAVNMTLLMTLLATIALVYFIGHVAQSIKISSIINLIMSHTNALIDDLFPSGFGQPWSQSTDPPLPTEPSAIILAHKNGYLQLVQEQKLMKAVMEADVVARLEYSVGDFVLHGSPLVTVWPAHALGVELSHAVQSSFVLGAERTLVDDPLFGVRQLSDIAVRALSSSDNDPSTAENCINALAVLMVKFLKHEPVSPYRCDDKGALRLIAPGPDFEKALDYGFARIIHYGADDVDTLRHLLRTIGELAYAAEQPHHLTALWQMMQLAMERAEQQLGTASERRKLNNQFKESAATFGQNLSPYLLPIEERATGRSQ